MHPIFKCVLPGRPEAVPYIWYILPLMLIYNLVAGFLMGSRQEVFGSRESEKCII